MKYIRIATACVDKLRHEGYNLDEKELAYIDEVTMIVLNEHEEESPDADYISKVLSISRTHLRRTSESIGVPQIDDSNQSKREGLTGFWKNVILSIESMLRGSSTP